MNYTNAQKRKAGGISIVVILIVLGVVFMSGFGFYKAVSTLMRHDFTILSNNENKDMEEKIVEFGKKNNLDIEFVYMDDLEAVDELNSNGSEYDAVWLQNSIWTYMVTDAYITESKSTSINPVVMGVKKSSAEKLGFTSKSITNSDILKAVTRKDLTYVMSSVTKTNTGFTAYLNFLNSLAGNPDALTEEMLENEKLLKDVRELFSGVERVSGSETFLEDMFLNSDKYESVVASESALIRINKKLINSGKEPLFLLYPKDGVAVNDSPFAYVKNDRDNLEDFKKIQEFIMSKDMQKTLEDGGRRTWYGGENVNANKNIFNKEWGIDTSVGLTSFNYPSKKVMTKAKNVYIEELRKPAHVVFCLDYSGSMTGRGVSELTDAMDYILDYDEASKDSLQFSKRDKITVIPFSTNVMPHITTNSGTNTVAMINNIHNLAPQGQTALFSAVQSGLGVLEKESDEYTKTIIVMTDGAKNGGISFYELKQYYDNKELNIPVYSILFGSAQRDQLEDLSRMSNAKIFDGRYNLKEAFKEVRSYN